jgi:xanthine permease XanP
MDETPSAAHDLSLSPEAPRRIRPLGRVFSARASARRKKPADLIYGVDESPPAAVIVISAVQHIGLLAIFLIYPLLVIKEAGVPATLSANILSLTMVAMGVATLLQSLPRGPIGSGFLCPATVSAVYLAPSLAAVKLGGLPLVFGMTVFAGIVESALSPVLRRIRPLLPPEIGGLVIFFVGTTVAVVGFRYIIGSGSTQPIGWAHWLVVAVTLGLTVALNVWAQGQARMFCALIGMAAGYAVATVTGVLDAKDLDFLAVRPLLAMPTFTHLSWTFSTAMILPFVIAALACTVKAVGLITVCERVNDAGWVRPDMSSLSRGVLADGLGTVLAGLLGTIGVNPSAPSVGLIAATDVASRVIAFLIGVMLIALAFLPWAAGILVLMPRPVMGASLIFAGCFILINGLQTITSRMLDARRTIVIGLAISSGIAAEIIPSFGGNVPTALQPIVGSSLVLGTVTALLLNGLFRLGQRKRASTTLDPTATADSIRAEEFFNDSGRRWGARADVMARVAFGINQAIEVIRDCCAPQGPLVVDAQFDEFNLNVQITYQGTPLELPDHRPSDKEIIESEQGHLWLAGFLLRRNADRIRIGAKDGATLLEFHFEH